MATATWDFDEGEEIVPGRLALRHLGTGERCETYLVWDQALFALAVAKLALPDQVEDPRALGELRREAEFLATLNHPAVVRAFDAVLEGPRPHLLLEHLEGPTLRSLITRFGPLPLEQLLPLALHVCSALHYLAGQQVVHLDVKPRNIIMGTQPRLIDLGLARTVPDARTQPGITGTPQYMAPEQCDPAARVAIGPATDVWGLAVSVYEAMTGNLPFPRALDWGEERAAGDVGSDGQPLPRFPQLTYPPSTEFPSYVPADLAAIVAAALRLAPWERPTAGELALSLEPFVAGLPQPVVGRRPWRFRSPREA